MEEFTPYPHYNPEDEYAPIDAQPAAEPETAPVSHDTPAPAEPQEPEVIPTVPVQPVNPVHPVNPVQQEYRPPYEAAPVQPAQPVQPDYGYPPQSQYPPQYPQAPQNQPFAPYPQHAPVPQMHQPVNGQPYPPYPPQDVRYSQPMNMPRQNPQNGYPQNPYTQPQGYPPYPQQAPQKPPKAPTPTGTKVFIIVLIALLAAMVIGFIVYVATAAKNTKPANTNPFDSNGSFPIDSGNDNNGFWYGEDSLTDPQEIEDEITLVADNGDTQKRDTDNKDSIGTPDENAKPLTLEELPKDKDDSKYTTNSAYESVCDSVVTVKCFRDEITDNDRDLASSGSGTIISADGYIITNAHVIGNSKEYLVQVVLNSGDKYQAKIVGYDTWTDLAVLKIDGKDFKPVTFGDSKLINVGDDVIAIGSPGGEKFQNSLTRGIVSAVDRELSINRSVRYIQSDAAISPGNSGGPLCNIYGQVIGITTVKTIATNFENMSFSIPSDTVKEIVDDLMRYGYVQERTRIGFMGSEISQQDVYYYGFPQGVQISEIDESGSLAGSKLKEGDIITELDGAAVTSFQDIYDVLADHKPGDKISVKAIRYE